jgi:A/G-specific adenine glycosylase
MDKRYFSDKIVEWYKENKRELPWRDTKDPYKIWLSEIILQQTRVLQGLPYYEKFVKRFPDVASLAKAPEQDVLRLWQGLGYYTRARNLHKCAKTVTKDFQSKFPRTFSSLKGLPGIGDYTAAAIASFAFRETVAVVDGNVFRVLARIYGLETPINTPAGKKIFTTLANELISDNAPDVHNQAIMEFGATFCTPKKPKCDSCPFASACFAHQNAMQHEFPQKLKLKTVRKRYFHYLVFKNGRSLLMKKRAGKDIWHGLYDFPLIEHSRLVDAKKILKGSELMKVTKRPVEAVTISETYKHMLTHQTIFCRFLVIDTPSRPAFEDKTSKFYSYSKISQLPKPTLITRFLEDHTFHS